MVTQTIAAEGGGLWKEYAGGYSDYVRQRPAASSEASKKAQSTKGRAARVKLSYKESPELEALPAEIEALELEQKTLSEKMHAPEYFRQPPETLRADQQRISAIEAALMEKLERWDALEAKAKAAGL